MMHTRSTPLTGKRVAAIFAGGFGIVIAVNLTMATMAVESFHGTVVDNSYVASQSYNGWLKQAAASKALGWQAIARRREDGRILLETPGVPADAQVSATAERPLGMREETPLTFRAAEDGGWISNETLAPGRWRMRTAIRAGGHAWAGESAVR